MVVSAEGSSVAPLFDAETDDTRFPVLDATALDELAEFGAEQELEAGEVLYRAGTELWSFYVVLDGHVEVARDDDSGQVVVRYKAGQFIGELGLLTGQRTYLTARAVTAARTLVLPPEEFRRMMATRPTIADVIFRALVGRRESLRGSAVADAVKIIGSRYSSDATALRSFADRNRLVYSWIDLEDAEDVEVALASRGFRPVDTPIVITPSAVLRSATPGEFAELLGLAYRPVPGRTFDLVVIGTGPAGLAASVYGASEGLDTVSLDGTAPGGQAGASSRIENYAGFPNGVSGGDLVARTAIQAQRLGARLASPCEVGAIRHEETFHVVTLVDGSEIPCRAVIVATGARYRRLDVPNLEQFEGSGVFYAATDLEARSCGSRPVIVVGGGNSAGQAAIFLSQGGCNVSVVIRKKDLSASMSRYLVDRISADPNIDVVTETEVRALDGETHLTAATLECMQNGERKDVECAGLFCFIGAVPATSLVAETVALDEKGFILTDRSLGRDVLTDPLFDRRDPLPFETSVPGVFAVGDVRSGSMKRVASAVGEGSSAVRSVHDYLSLHS
jgi:thioredoxin reductase (NADPH)